MPRVVHSFTAEADRRATTLITPVHISQAFDPAKGGRRPKPKSFHAIWDTGATGSVISEKVVKECGLKPIGMATVHHGGGQDTRNVYLVNVFLPNQVEVVRLRVTDGKLRGADVLIGMDIINQGDFAVTNKGGKTTFSFRLPSIAKIDFVKEGAPIEMPLKKTTPKVGRNDPCPCGSGKKYKKCCGK